MKNADFVQVLSMMFVTPQVESLSICYENENGIILHDVDGPPLQEMVLPFINRCKDHLLSLSFHYGSPMGSNPFKPGSTKRVYGIQHVLDLCPKLPYLSVDARVVPTIYHPSLLWLDVRGAEPTRLPPNSPFKHSGCFPTFSKNSSAYSSTVVLRMRLIDEIILPLVDLGRHLAGLHSGRFQFPGMDIVVPPKHVYQSALAPMRGRQWNGDIDGEWLPSEDDSYDSERLVIGGGRRICVRDLVYGIDRHSI